MSAGRLILCGSGEFTSAMDEIDRAILEDMETRTPRVAIVPTAAGLEDTPKSWTEMGMDHFRGLGAQGFPVMVLNRADAHDARWCEAISSADWIYFSGGKPGYLVETLEGSPFWSAVLARHGAGAALAGSSAGAMMLGTQTIVPEDLDANGIPRRVWMRKGLGVLPGIFIAPHFDAVPEDLWLGWFDVWPEGHRMLGIDEDTALVQEGEGWIVRGKGRALTFRSAADRVVHERGTRLDSLSLRM